MPTHQRNVDKRRTILMLVILLFRYCGLGHLRGVGQGLGPRERITYTLTFIFGVTFATGAFWYSNPDVDHFIASLLHLATGGRVCVTADVSGLFVRRVNGTYRVCEVALRRLGCTTQELFELLRRTPGALAEFRAANAAPLIVPREPLVPPQQLLVTEPDNHDEEEEVMISPHLFDVDEAHPPPILNFADDLSSTLTSTTSLYGADGDEDDLLDFTFEENSELQDTVDELRGAESELEAVWNRLRALLTRRRDALGEAPGRVTGNLEKLLNDVRSLRSAAEIDRDAGVARAFSSIF